jgi:WD40 repeat protein
MSTESGEVTPPRRYLIATAVSEYRDPAWDIPGLDDARQQIVDLFTRRLGYEHVSTLGLNPTRDQILSAIRTFCRADDRRPDDLLAVYISSHGQVLDDGRHVLLTADTDPADIEFSALPTADLAKVMLSGTGIRRVLLMLDVCYAEQGGNLLAANALESMGSSWARDPGSGLVIVSSARPHQAAQAGLFPSLLTGAVNALPVAGHSPAHLRIDALVMRMNDDPEQREWQRVGLVMAGLDGPVPPFFANPRYDRRLTGVDLAVQEAARYEQLDQVREQTYTNAMLVKAMAHPGNDARAGWWFRGRHAALESLAAWMRGTGSCQVVTAGPGSGKTALLGLVATITHPKRRPSVPFAALNLSPDMFPETLDAVVYAQHLTDRDVIEALAAAARVTADSVGSLLTALGSPGRPRPFTVIIDGLDEAATPESLCSGVLRQLVEHSEGRIRLLLGTRPYLLEHLGQPPDRIVDLDTGRFADQAALMSYTVQTLIEAQRDSPYRTAGSRVREVAEAVVDAAGTSFLVARIAAGTLAAAGHAVADPQSPEWRRSLPRHADQAMREDLERRLGPEAQRAVDLLRPLAFAQGEGLPWENLWAPLASAMSGHDYTDEDVLWLRRTAGAYVVESVDGDRSAYRIYHQALIEHLSADLDEAAVHSAFVDVLTRSVPYRADATRHWARAHPYALHHLGFHAGEAGRIDELLADAEFLVHAEPWALKSHLGRAASGPARMAAAVYRASIDTHMQWSPEDRRLILAIDAARAQATTLQEQLVSQIPIGGWIPHLATGTAFTTAVLDVLPDYSFDLFGIAFAELDGETIVIAVARSRINVWNLRTGKPQFPPIVDESSHLFSVAVTAVNGRPTIITPGPQGSLRMWCLRTGTALGDIVTGSTDGQEVVACSEVGGAPVVITTSRAGTASVWNLETLRQHGKSIAVPPQNRLGSAVISTTVIDDVPTIVFADGSSVATWNLHTGEVHIVGLPTLEITALACTAIDGEPVVVTGCHDGAIRLWSLRDYRPIGGPMTGHTSAITAIACYHIDGVAMAMAADLEEPVRVWNLSTATAVVTLMGHTSSVTKVQCAIVNGAPIGASGGSDCSLRLWQLPKPSAPPQPAAGLGHKIRRLVYRKIDGIPTAATVNIFGWTSLWDLSRGRALVDHHNEQTVEYDDIEGIDIDSHPHVVVNEGTGLRVWNLKTGGTRVLRTTERGVMIDAMSCTEVDGSPVALVATDDGCLSIWDLTTGNRKKHRPLGFFDGFGALPCTTVDGEPLVFSVGRTKAFGSGSTIGRVWNLRSGTEKRFPVNEGTESFPVASATIDGAPVAVTYTSTSIEAWNLSTGQPLFAPIRKEDGHTRCIDIGFVDDTPVAASTNAENSLYLWNLRTGQHIETLRLPWPDQVVLTPENEIVVSLYSDIVVLRRKQPTAAP